MDIASTAMEKILSISEELEIRGGRTVILNDLALPFYGLIKPVDELRILVYHENLDEIAYHVSNILGVAPYRGDIYKSLKTIGIAVINPVILPMVIVEIPRSQIDYSIMDRASMIRINNRRLYIPRLEDFIVKMFAIGKYPYTCYAYTLMTAYIDEINRGEVLDRLRILGFNTDKVIENIEVITRFIDILS